ncbi:hypothetical protein JY742_18085 [Clostridioides difficile]|nr:hypothetical protein [Clostridioides difficile]
MTAKLTDNASLRELITAFDSIKTDLQSSKSNIINTLGAPATSNDKLSTIPTRINTLKSNYQIQIDNLNTQISNLKIAKGTFSMTTRLSSYAFDAGFNIYSHSKTQDKAYFIEINNLAFAPDLIILEYKSYDGTNQYTICSLIENPSYNQYYFLEFYSLLNSNIRTDEFKRVTKRDFGYFKIPICVYQTVIEQQYNLEGNVIKWTALQI